MSLNKRNAQSSFSSRVSKEVQKLFFFLDPDHYALWLAKKRPPYQLFAWSQRRFPAIDAVMSQSDL